MAVTDFRAGESVTNDCADVERAGNIDVFDIEVNDFSRSIGIPEETDSVVIGRIAEFFGNGQV